MTVLHNTFSLERTYPVSPERVFAAWADPVAKQRWFVSAGAHELDFRVGGRETIEGRTPGGGPLHFAATYHDIVPQRRIVFTGTLTGDGSLATVSTTTVELFQEGDGTRLVLTEQDTFLDGAEQPEWREQGTSDWLAKLGKELES
ncbi:SRPBCC family protein [Amycolatopsis sp. CA-126428]|uniref:SRPBCC family protein n=1 Tax=Amycolatopsis sp. CA-126428 TaxID=2073158 RepID=UPI000CCFDB44|nr:SRPBCC family protein [Amycolatopsis sp. CA-126428]